ncbi:MAG: AAA family ATPase [Elusimicrobiota bacterium]
MAVAGPNGAGKTTFYHAHIAPAALRYVSADVLARELEMDAYTAAKAADSIRRALLKRRESFAFETVFSDPVGDKLSFLKGAVTSGYTVVLCFIGLADAALSEERVAMRVSQGGHDVPTEKLKSRFPRTLSNLKAAMRVLPHVYIFDNSDLGHPFRRVNVFKNGRPVQGLKAVPDWFKGLA